MPKTLATLIIIFLSTISLSSHADRLEFALSNEVVEASYQSFFAGGFGTDFSLFHADEDNIRSDLLGLGLYARGKAGQFRSRFGGKLFWLDIEKSEAHGAALGGAVDFYFVDKAFFTTEILWAPDILTGGDFENYTELSVRISYDVLPNASVFAGYQFNEAEINDLDVEIYDGGLLGFSFNF